jgi:serine/threonine protein phosphatase 1
LLANCAALPVNGAAFTTKKGQAYMKFLRSLFARGSEPQMPETAPADAVPPQPEQPLFVVGDLHGRVDLFERMLEQIDLVIGKMGLTNPKIIFVGDIIDRGPESAKTIARLIELTGEFPDNVVCLLGNHEQMLLDFLESPEARHARWFRNGGRETCESFGIQLPLEDEMAAKADQIAAELTAGLGQTALDWLKARPIQLASGNVVIAHAGLDPGRPLSDQSDRVMIWGHPEFMQRSRTDDIWVAHGHIVVDEAICADSRISVDTGAWSTERLTAALILPEGRVEFLQARG